MDNDSSFLNVCLCFQPFVYFVLPWTVLSAFSNFSIKKSLFLFDVPFVIYAPFAAMFKTITGSVRHQFVSSGDFLNASLRAFDISILSAQELRVIGTDTDMFSCSIAVSQINIKQQ